MSADSKRTSERVIPMVSDEEMVVIELGDQRFLSKMMDLSDGGSLVYLLSDAEGLGNGTPCELVLFHRGDVFSISAFIARATGRLLAFQFSTISPESLSHLQAKLIRMEVEWNRIQGLV